MCFFLGVIPFEVVTIELDLWDTQVTKFVNSNQIIWFTYVFNWFLVFDKEWRSFHVKIEDKKN